MHILLYLKVIQTQRLVLIFASLILKEWELYALVPNKTLAGKLP